MEKFRVFILLLIAIVNVSNSEPAAEKEKPRQSRNFDNDFSDYGNFFKSNEAEDASEAPVYMDSRSKPARPERKDSEPKDKSAYKFVPYYYPAIYKGYPYYGKGISPSQNDPMPPMPPMTPEQMMEMMTMMQSMTEIEKGESDNVATYLTKLFSSPKSILVAALIPVSIMLASFIPLLVNYFMSGASLPSLISTVASSKLGRSLGDVDRLHTLFQSIEKYGRKLESYECFEESVCRMATASSESENNAFIKRAVKVIATIVKPEALGHSRLSKVLSAIKNNNCSNICGENKEKR